MNILGLDIGTKYIKLCSVDKKSDEFVDVKSVMEMIPETDKSLNSDKVVAGIIREMMKATKYT